MIQHALYGEINQTEILAQNIWANEWSKMSFKQKESAHTLHEIDLNMSKLNERRFDCDPYFWTHWHVRDVCGWQAECLLIDRGHYFLLRAAIFARGHFEDLCALGVIGAFVRWEEPKPHDDEAELSTCAEKETETGDHPADELAAEIAIKA